MQNCLARSALALAAAAGLAPSASAQTVVEVNDGEVLTQAELEAGLFGEQVFALEPATTFEINAGGVIGPAVHYGPGFGFGGSTVNLYSGSAFASGSSGPSHVSDAVVNVLGGTVGEHFNLYSGGVLNLFDGSVGRYFQAFDASEVNVEGGSATTIELEHGSRLNFSGGYAWQVRVRDNASAVVSGGTIDSLLSSGDVELVAGAVGRLELSGGDSAISGGAFGRFKAFGGVLFLGGEFKLDGVPVVALPAGLGEHVFTGTLADGGVVILSGQRTRPFVGDDEIGPGGLELVPVALPPADATPMVIVDGAGPAGLREGQTLTIGGTAVLREHFGVVGATLNIEGGFVGRGLEAAFSDVRISGGVVGNDFTVYSGTVLEVSGGSIGAGFRARQGSSVSISGGAVGDNAQAHPETTLSISGGRIGSSFTAYEGSLIDISGGTIGPFFSASGAVTISGGTFGRRFQSSGATTISGGEFMLDGVPVSSLSGEPLGGVFTGTLADGSVFVFANLGSYGSNTRDILAVPTLLAAELPPLDTQPMTFTEGSGPAGGLRPGQSLTLAGTASLRDGFAVAAASLAVTENASVGEGLEAAFSDVAISGGSVGSVFEAYSSEVDVSGGSIGPASAFYGSTVNISGGRVGERMNAYWGSTINLSGGEIGSQSVANTGAVVNVSGGRLGEFFTLGQFAKLNISGGEIGHGLYTGWKSEIHMRGTAFAINGAAIEGLVPGEPFVISQRKGVLSATLTDGSPLTFRFAPGDCDPCDIISPDTVLTVTLVSDCPADYDGDGAATVNDLLGYLGAFRSGDADVTGDGVTDVTDLLAFLGAFREGC